MCFAAFWLGFLPLALPELCIIMTLESDHLGALVGVPPHPLILPRPLLFITVEKVDEMPRSNLMRRMRVSRAGPDTPLEHF